MAKIFTMSSGAARILSVISALVAIFLLAIGVIGVHNAGHQYTVHESEDATRRHQTTTYLRDDIGNAQLLILSALCVILGVLVLVGETGRPRALLRQCLFLRTHFGRALLFVFVGAGLLLMGQEYTLALAGACCALFVAAVDLLVACPCCGIEGADDDNVNFQCSLARVVFHLTRCRVIVIMCSRGISGSFGSRCASVALFAPSSLCIVLQLSRETSLCVPVLSIHRTLFNAVLQSKNARATFTITLQL
jgi:hypothetical protein